MWALLYPSPAGFEVDKDVGSRRRHPHDSVSWFLGHEGRAVGVEAEGEGDAREVDVEMAPGWSRGWGGSGTEREIWDDGWMMVTD